MKQVWLVNKEHVFPLLVNGNTKANFSFLSLLLFIIFSSTFHSTQAQEINAADNYKKVVTERSAKIIAVLQLKDSNQYKKVLHAVAGHYINTNQIHESFNIELAAIKKEDKEEAATKIAVAEAEAVKLKALSQLHTNFIAELKKTITNEQLDKIKDGMTYKIYPITYAAYQDMLPNLSVEQKLKIDEWLKEARELAMDAESAEKKHAVFGKYKGRINNYLSAAGYDLKKETEAWQQRIKEREAEKNKKQQATK
ncbi:MAG: DUF3826 domain-containing protein [Flavihumibacter sp.]|nr:DUF3826 domain-containing protein [Flavihumibacter sp.]